MPRHPLRRPLASLAVLAVGGSLLAAAPAAHADALPTTTSLVSTTSAPAQVMNHSYAPSVSADGRYVAFESLATNLVDGDDNNRRDIFVRDTVTGVVTRVTVRTDGTQATGHSYAPSISADGRYVAFASDADNLVTGDDNFARDIFVHDTQTGTTTRVSVDSDEVEGTGTSSVPSISADGLHVAFQSDSDNLVASDTNNAPDVFVRDTVAGTTTRVSVDAGGAQANDNAERPSISADGRYVAFESDATNLVAGDTNNQRDIFVRDTTDGTTTRASVDSDEAESNGFGSYDPAISADGRFVTFDSTATNLVANDTNGAYDVFVRDTQSGTTTRVSVDSGGTEGSGPSSTPAISADGRYVTFVSSATNLVAGDTNGTQDIFVHDTQAGATTRVSVATGGTESDGWSDTPSISADGRYVAFVAAATDLVAGDTNGYQDAFVRDTQTGATTRVSVTSGASADSSLAAVSADGRYVAFSSDADNLVANDTNGVADVFVRDTQSGTTTRASVDSSGVESNGWGGVYSLSISADGRYVAFDSDADNLVAGDTNGYRDIFVRDTVAGTTTRVSVDSDGNDGNDGSYSPSISADGRYVTFESNANNLVANDTNGGADVFVRDTQSGTTTRVSLDTGGVESDGWSDNPTISADGRYVAFASDATNLVAGDTNGAYDVFVHDTQSGTTTRVSVDSDGNDGNDDSYGPSISADGRYVAFVSDADNLVAGDANGVGDVFVRDTQTGATTRVSVATGGVESNGRSDNPAISADGRYTAFEAAATNLVAGDTNGYRDIFVRDTFDGTTTRVSVATGGAESVHHSSQPALSANGRSVAFQSYDAGLASGGGVGYMDVFLTEMTLSDPPDTTGPIFGGPITSPQVDGDGNLPWTSDTDEFTFTAPATDASGPVTYAWTLNGAPVAGQTGDTMTTTLPALGDHTVSVTAADASANTTTQAATFTAVAVDSPEPPNTPPTVKVTKKKKATAKAHRTVKVVATDAEGVARVEASAVQKRGKRWFFFTGTKWVKAKAASPAKSKKKALRKAAVQRLNPVDGTTRAVWKVRLPGLAKGRLVLRVSVTDTDDAKAAAVYRVRLKR